MINMEQKYIQMAEDGLSYEQIKEALLHEMTDQQQISSIMKKVDVVILEKTEEKAETRAEKEKIMYCLFIILIGASMIAYSFINDQNNYLYIVYAAIAAAFYTIINASRRLRS